MAPKRIYVFGLNESLLAKPELARFIQIYNPKVNIWINGSDVPTSRIGFGVAVVNDKLYIIGGYTNHYLFSFSDLFNKVTPINLNEVYTPVGYGTPDPSYVPSTETTPPKISALSPLNLTYNDSSVSLVFAVDKMVNWTGYSLDGKDNVTVLGNTTLSGLSNGMHNVTVYAEDSFGNIGASETITFTIAKPESFPTVPVVAASIAVAVVCVGVILYLRKRLKAV